MLSKPLVDAINEQINFELASAYLYLAMSAHFEGENLGGFAQWMRVQYQEETGHAMKFFRYVYERGGKVTLKAIPQPTAKFKTPLEVFNQVLEHEQKVTASINKLYELALKEKDYAAQHFFHAVARVSAHFRVGDFGSARGQSLGKLRMPGCGRRPIA